MNPIRNLPNILTLINLLLGCIAITYVYYDHMVIIDQQRNTYINIGRMEAAGFCIFFAAVIDFFDGFIARLLKAQTEIGKQLDSLADVVTFGVAPGIIMYQLFARSYYASADAFDYPVLYFTIAFIIPAGAAWRLAKFNIQNNQTTQFLGLPTPAAALFIAALPMLILRDEFGMSQILNNKWVLLSIAIAITYLMISNIPMLSLKMKSLAFAENKWTYGLMAFSVILAILSMFALQSIYLIIPVVIVGYILLSIVKNIAENGI
ncbi:MAG: CDP-alcohol phosphatidyltransferase family protein [Chitinophagales bacterium]